MIAAAIPLSETPAADRTRGLGRLVAGNRALPLAGVAIRARVADRVAQVALEQTFQNPYAEALEAVYIFPLAGGSAVSAFEMKVGDRVIKGIVKERGQARADYRQAVQDGKRAALLEQDRDDVFTVQVGNLPPGETVSVRITYSERLPFFDDGSTELRLPLVVAPRYIPGKPLDRAPVGDGTIDDTDQVPDASRITPPRLAPGFDPKVALRLEVALEDERLDDLSCSQHAVQLKKGVVALARQDELLDRDFVLRWRPSDETLKTSLLATKDGYGLLSLLPPKRDGYLGLARDVVFILDRSGSMGGIKMASAARACSLLIDTLGPRDRFDVCAFDDSTEWLGWSAADEAGRQKGHAFLRKVDARGGTELAPAMKETLARFEAVEGRAKVVVVITDGQVGNESEVLKRVQKDGGDLRLFTLGIDTAVNAGFLKRLAALGGGTSTFVEPGAALDDALVAVGREIGAPLVVDLAIEGAEAAARMPDLFAGRAASVFLRAKPGATVTLKGKYADGKPFSATVKAKALDLPAIAHLWAKAKVADLEDRYRLEPQNQAAIEKEIVTLAVAHTLLTRFTAFVVVDESEIVNPEGQGRKVVQPVHMPSKWEMESLKCAEMAAPAPCGAPPAASRSRVMTKKCMALPLEACDEEVAPEPEPKATPAQEKALVQAVDALRQALEAARKAVAEGRRPDRKAIEKARDAVRKALAGTPLETSPLQRALRVEVAEALAALTTADALAVLDRAIEALTEKPFWAASV